MRKNIFKHISVLTFIAAIGFTMKYTVNIVSNMWIKTAIGYMPETVIYHWSFFAVIGCIILSASFLAIHAKLSRWDK